MNKNELIKNIELINPKDFAMAGGVARFNKTHPKLLSEINKHTLEIQTYFSNKRLSAKLVYLKKYQGKIKNITTNGSVMIFDPKLFDFKLANINTAQKQWDECRIGLLSVMEYYTINETKKLLSDSNGKYYGKSGNRKLLRDNKKLFVSLYHHTSFLNSLNGNLKKFSMRIYILINDIQTECLIHKHMKHWKFNDGIFTIVCSKCEPKYPSPDFFKKKYGNDWEKHLKERQIKVSHNKTNSLMWFKKKYGSDLGVIKYRESVTTKMTALTKLKANRYSKISQELFWMIYNRLNDKSEVYFPELNFEYVLSIPKKYNHNMTVMMLDFKQRNKVIEYNGKYWHSKERDKIRRSILEDMGYDVLFIDSDEFNRNNKNVKIIEKCINFLQ